MSLRALAVLALFAAPAVLADEPVFVVHHQGRLLRGNDAPATDVTELTVGLYATETSETPVWSETYPVTVGATGLYAVALGDTRGGRKAITAASLAGDRWMSVTVGALELKPRLRLGSTPYALVASDARSLGGAPAADFLKRAEFDSFKTALTGGGGSLTVPWSALRDIPADFGAGLRTVATTGATLAGAGTAASPLQVADAGIGAAQIKDGAVTPAKIAATGCTNGQVLKIQGGAWQCGSDAGSGSTLPFSVTAPLEEVAGVGGAAPGLLLRDAGIGTAKLADGAVTAAKLAADPLALGKVTGGAIAATALGSVGIGAASPTARLEVEAFASAGTVGPGLVDYAANATTVALTEATFGGLVRAGDSIQLGTRRAGARSPR